MRKEIVKFVTGTLVNVLMSIVILSLLGVQNAAAWGVAAGVVIPMALGKFMPEGAALEGVYTEVWTGELVKQLRGGMTASFLDGVSDYSAAVNNEVVHLVDVGGDPDVLINNTTYPIAAQELEDGETELADARQELAETYPRELVDKCLMPHFYYASPKAFADVPVGVADRSLSLSGYDIRFFIDNLEVGELNDFSLDELSSKIKQLCVEHKSEHLSALLEVPSDASEGVVYDIKQVLLFRYFRHILN